MCDSCAACMNDTPMACENVLWHVRMYHVSKYVHYEAGVPVVEVKWSKQVCIAGHRVLVMILFYVSEFDRTNVL